MKGTHYEVVYTWQNGDEEVRYCRPRDDIELAVKVLKLQREARKCGYKSPYLIRGTNDNH